MTKAAFKSATELRSMLTTRQISALEIIEECESQIDRHNATLNAIVTLDLDHAREVAKRSDIDVEDEGLLNGIPIVVKDVFNTRGLRSTFGNSLYKDHIPDFDDIVVERERAAGAIIVGKSNTPDCASGGRTQNTIFGLTRNPWDHSKTTSGSGGGGTVAVATGMAPLADGSDVGGSVRSPGGWTNVVGFRPTSGRIPGLIGSIADGRTSTSGIFSRTVQDAALFLEAVEGPDPRCPVPLVSGDAVRHQQLDLKPQGLAITWVQNFANLAIADEISTEFQALAKVMQEAGFTIIKRDFDPCVGTGINFKKTYSDFTGYACLVGLPKKVRDNFLAGGETKYSIANAVNRYLSLDSFDIYQLFDTRNQLARITQSFMQQTPIIASPMHLGHAFDAEDQNAEDTTEWGPMFHAPMLSLPSICVPGGFTRDGMPHGVMFTARCGQDQLLLQVARAFERATGFGQLLPPRIG